MHARVQACWEGRWSHKCSRRRGQAQHFNQRVHKRPSSCKPPIIPVQAAASLKPLIDTALRTVPKELQVGLLWGIPRCIQGEDDAVCMRLHGPSGHGDAKKWKCHQPPTLVHILATRLQASTPLSLKATAGLRLLPGEQAANILAAVTADLKKTPFKMAPDAVGIMDGGWGCVHDAHYLLACAGEGCHHGMACWACFQHTKVLAQLRGQRT